MDTSFSGSSFNSRLAHAQSTPAGVDGSGISSSKTPPTTPKKSGKMLAVRVQMLDDSITIFQVQAKAVGRLLFEQVCKQLNLLEADYFGLEYQDATTKYWLDFEKPMHRQIGLSLMDPFLKFCVKFYTPDPAQLEEEYTRYLFCLQIKRDLMQGDLQCNDNTAALIISYIVQAECGDYSPEDYPDHTYLSSLKFVSYQDKELERKIMENHKRHAGQSPAEADLNLLETARRCELYGMKMHAAKDQEGVPLNLSVAHMGIVVFQNCTKINTFSWAKIRKISFKRKRFLIKLHPEGYGYYKDIVEFIFDNRNQCKSFWKKCVENHGFFRCSYVKCIPRQKARVLSRGSSFRYSGKTQKQMVEYVRENYVKRQTFQRSQSFRHQSSLHSSVVNVGASISAHPLLPLGENAIAGSGASLSCESMTLSGSLSPTTLQDGGPQTAPTVMTQQQQAHPQTQQHHPSQPHQMQVDLHEPATTSSDITSIASQSPPFDTGQNRHYQTTGIRNRLTQTLNTNHSKSYVTVRSNPSKNNTVSKVGSHATTRAVLNHSSKELNYDHARDKVRAELRFRNVAQKLSNKSTCSRSNINDPDILKDLGEPVRGEEFSWQRSASCKELSAVQKQERLLLKDDVNYDETAKNPKMAVNKFDSYRYCYSCYGQPPLFDSINRDREHVDTKVYSSSYPGTITSASVENKNQAVPVNSAGTSPGLVTVYMDNEVDDYDNDYEEIDKDGYQKLSADDLSHDSYEIIDRESIFRSRSCSVDSEDMFVMENDYKNISQHILWREGSNDVEKRLGYVEPRYRNIDFNEFNEICKRGFALRNRDASQSHGNIKFSEFSVKSGGNEIDSLYAVVNKKRSPNTVAHESVSRTKSDPYMSKDHKSSNRQKLFGLHQKSFDMVVTNFGDSVDEYALSKSDVDLSYTLRIRNQMNGTAKDLGDQSPKEVSGLDSKITHVPFSSPTLGGEINEDNEMDLQEVMLTKNNYEQVVTTKKSTKLMLSLSEENESANPISGESSPLHQNKEEGKSSRRGTKRTSNDPAGQKENVQPEDKQHIVKVKSVETPKKSHSSKIRKSRSAETCDNRGSFLRADSAGSRGKKEIIVIDSDDYHSFDDSQTDKRSDGSDSVLIVEYRGNKKKKLSKKASSDSRGSQAESEASSFDAPRIKKKDLKKRNTGQTYFYKDRIPTIEISEDETYKAESNANSVNLNRLNNSECSSDERHASGSDLSKTELIVDENSFLGDSFGRNESITDNDDIEKDAAEKNETVELDGGKKDVSLSSQVPKNDSLKGKKFSEVVASVAEKSPQVLRKLGLSEGSAIVPLDPSPQATRRAKSLDTPIVSLNRLPPITSFSSKDDTVDNEEAVILEQKNSKSATSEQIITLTSDTPTTENAGLKRIAEEKPEIKPKPKLKPFINRLKSNSIAVSAFRKQSLDAQALEMDNATKLPEGDQLNKERSKSEGYDRNLSKLSDSFLQAPERKHSTRQERLDSFKKLKNFSIELWDIDDVENSRKKITDPESSREYEDDNVFEDNDDAVVPVVSSEKDGSLKNQETRESVQSFPPLNIDAKEDVDDAHCAEEPSQKLVASATSNSATEGTKETENVIPSTSGTSQIVEFKQNVLERRSFDEEQSSSSSIHPELIKYPLESSGSSSVDEAILPPDYIDEDLPALAPMHMTLDMVTASNLFGVKPLTASLAAPFNFGFSSLSRTLSRISERSTTSEQERTEMDDDSTKPLSRSLSIDDSILSSDQHPSLSSDPPSGMNLENVFDEDDDIGLIPPVDLVEDRLDFSIPPPLLGPEDEDWPSPPPSPSSVLTPVIDNKQYSSVPGSGYVDPLENQEPKEEGSNSEENKTFQDDGDDTSNGHDNGEKYRKERTRGSIGDDTSIGLTTSDLSSSTGNTVHACAGASGLNKSEDNSLAGSLSTDIVSESRKSSIDETQLSYEKKYLTLDRKQTAADRMCIRFPPKFRSFDDGYDSPCTESDDTPSSPILPMVLKKKLPPPPPPQQPLEMPEIPPPLPRHYQDAVQSSAAKLRSRVERNRAAKLLPHNTSSSMSTSLESPTSSERKLATAVAKAKCHSHFSLRRSPPSDCSSSSVEASDTPSIPNTIPRVSRRRRHAHTPRRRQHRFIVDALHGASTSSAAQGQHDSKQYYHSDHKSRQY